MNDDTKFIICDCYNHGLFVEKIEEDDQKDLYISLFNRGFSYPKMPWKQRFRWIWKILTKGHPYTDMIILNESKVKDFQLFLSKNFDE